MRISTSENQFVSIMMDLGDAGKKIPSIVGAVGLSIPSLRYLNSSSWAIKSFSTSVVLRHFIMFKVSLLIGLSERPHPTLSIKELAISVDFSAVKKPHGAFMVPLCKITRRTKCRLMGDNR